MEDLREKIPIIIAIIIAIATIGLVIYFMEFCDTIYYTQVDNTKIERVSSSDNMKYEYTLKSYNEHGSEKELKFKTSRGVHSWEEVSYDELPDKVKTNYMEKYF